MSKITRIETFYKPPSSPPHSSPKTPPRSIPRPSVAPPRATPVVKPSRAMVAVAKGPSLADVPTRFAAGVKIAPKKPTPGTAY